MITDLQIGGAPQVVKELACALASARGRLSFDVRVVCLAPVGPVAEQLTNLGIATYCLGALGPWDVRVFWRLGRLLNRFQPHILHCSLMHANIAGRIVGYLLSVPRIIASIHTAQRDKNWHLKLENLTCRLSSVTVCVSPSVQRHVARYANIPPSRLVVIPNGIDFRRHADAEPVDLTSLGLSPERTTLIFVSRLDPVKAIDVLLRALNRLIKVNKCDVQLMVVGDGPERLCLEDLSSSLEINNRVCFCGTRCDVPGLLRSADIFVQPSLWEGLPLTVLEAMAASLPIVASRTDGLIDVIEHGRTGILVPPGDPDQLAREVLTLIQQPSRAARLAAAARQSVEQRFSLDSMLQAYHDLYQRVISLHGDGITNGWNGL